MTVTPRKPVGQRYLLRFWLPLAGSWLLMESSFSIVQAAMARLPDAEINLAALGITFSLLFLIETPVIMLQATSTALCRDRTAYLVLRRFVIWLILILTAITALLAFTPVYEWIVVGVIGVPHPIAAAARPALGIMLPWSATIGWRRFYQGILIRFGETRRVASGTIIRFLSSVMLATAFVWWRRLPGIWAGSCAFIAGMLIETVVVTWLVRPAMARHLSPDSRPATAAAHPLTMRRVIRFHVPLVATALLNALSQPLISAALARSAFPEESLAAWPVAFGVLVFILGLGRALQEVVITLTDGPETLEPVRHFTLRVAAGTALLLSLFAFSPLADFYLGRIAGLSPQLARFVVPGLQLAVLLPGLTAIQSWLRGRLMKAEATASIYQARGLNLALTAAVMAVGVALKTPGVQMTALALTVALVGEVAYLEWRIRSAMAKRLVEAC